MKETGNKLFQKERYEQASKVYVDALLEIEELVEGNNALKNYKELKELEIGYMSKGGYRISQKVLQKRLEDTPKKTNANG